MDVIYQQKGYLWPDMREGYELMISLYEKLGLQDMQLFYVKWLLRADCMLQEKYTYLKGKIHKEYDTRKLEQQKKEIETSLSRRKYNDKIFITVITGLCLFVVGIIVRYLKNKKETRRKYEALLHKLEASKKAKSSTSEENGLSMSKGAETRRLRFYRNSKNLSKVRSFGRRI